ncbi:UNVERIFIED_CONTAM: Molybdopterin synthase catalytic subunit, partial [Siphonaria sp. JEL0065]
MKSQPTINKTLVAVADKISTLDQLVQDVGDDSCGAIATFSGTTRNSFQGKEVTQLAYEAYVPMAIKQIEIAIEAARAKWPQLTHVAVHHKLGIVPCGDSSVIIAVSSPHRRD